MKRFWRVLSGFVAAVCIVLPISAAADSLSQSVIVTVRATVLPARYIVVDKQGAIQSIISNTDEDVTPTAYLGSVKAGNAVPVTPQLLDSYEQIMRNVPAAGAGVLYKRPATAAAPARKQQPPIHRSNVLQLFMKKRA